MAKKRVITKKNTKKKVLKKKVVLVKKSKASKANKKSVSLSNSLELLFKENENQLTLLITKEFDKEIALKAKTYIKSYSKIEDSIITVNDFLNYLENLDEELLNYLKLIPPQQTQTPLYQMKNQRKKKNLLE